jgi:uncharacterized protein involved in exopolysaccharide biosynthesis
MNEVSLKEVLEHLKDNILKIFFISLTISILTAIYSLNVQKIYKSEALIRIAESSGQSKVNGGISDLAQFAGIDLSAPDNKKSPEYVKAIISSRDFFKDIIKFEGIIEGITSHNGFNQETKELIYIDNDTNSLKKNGLNFYQAHKKFLASINVNIDKKTGFIFLSYESSSPYFAKKILDLVFTRVNTIEMQRDAKQIEKKLTYLKDLQQNNNISAIGLSLSSLITSLIQDQMLSQVKESYLIEFIDKPYASESRIYPERAKMVLISAFLSFLFLLLGSLFNQFVINENKR